MTVCLGSALSSCDDRDDESFETRWRAASDREQTQRAIPPERGVEWHVHRGILQDKLFEEVREAVKSLPRGSSKSEVVAALGAPAQFSESEWAYMTVDPEGILSLQTESPNPILLVRFRDGKYEDHETRDWGRIGVGRGPPPSE